MSARLVRVAPLTGTMWRFEVGVRFDMQLPDAILHELERRAAQNVRE